MKLTKEKALTLLKEDVVKNLPLIRFMEEVEPEEVTLYGRSIVARFDGTICISCQHHLELVPYLAPIAERGNFFAAIDPELGPLIKAAKEIPPAYEACLGKYILLMDAPLPEPKNHVVTLPLEYAPMVDKHWTMSNHDNGSIEYVRNRLMNGPTAAVFKNHRPIGWCATHADHAPGFIYVEEEYRNQGIATDLTISIIQQQRALGYPTYISIADDNEKSQAVASKLGFKKVGYIMWLGYE